MTVAEVRKRAEKLGIRIRMSKAPYSAVIGKIVYRWRTIRDVSAYLDQLEEESK